MNVTIWQTEFDDGPTLATALHEGSRVRAEVEALMNLDAAERRYEEDPHTGLWTTIAPTRIISGRSRFELDLNRPRELAVYLKPDDAWGLDVWRSPPPEELVQRSLAAYDDFYAHLRLVIERLLLRHPRLVVFDLHSYNQRRGGPGSELADPRENPEINLGTRSMDRHYWAPLVDRWLAEMAAYDYFGRRLDVRENVRFFGGHMARWLHDQFPRQVCVLAIEARKFFMDEWTGRLDPEQHEGLHRALAQAAAAASDVLENWGDATTNC